MKPLAANHVNPNIILPPFLLQALACILMILGWMLPGEAQTSPGQSGQFNRIGSVMTVAEVYTSAAAAQLGGAANLEVDMNNNLAAANVAMQNSGTGIWVDNVGYYEATEADPGTLHALLGEFWTWSDVASFWSSTGAGIIQCVGIGTDDAGLSYECGSEGTVSAVYLSANVFAHELGRNNCCEQGDGFGGAGLVTIMLFNYCSGNNLLFFSNPGVYYNGIQLLGNTSEDCGEGPLANEGNNARQFTLNGPNYQGSKPVALSSLNVYNPLLTAVHCGGAAVATQAADQRTFAADQNYSGGTAWDANGYNYAVDLSGVTNPAPQTTYQDQRYGNCGYTFNNYLPGTNYLVRLHCMECCWSGSGERIFNVFINGQKVLTNFDIYATAGADNRAVIKEIMTKADPNGRIAIGFSNVVDNASISAIEILQGGVYAPINLVAAAGNAQVTLSWSPVAGATSYNVQRATVSGGPYITVGSATSTNYNNNPVAGVTTYYYVVSALNGGNQSFNSLEAAATTPVTVNSDTWLGGSGNNFSTQTNWIYASGSGPVSNTDALVFGSVGSTTPDNNESAFSYSTLTFNTGAQGYTIGGNAFSLGTNSAGPVIAVNSANSQIINDAITLLGGSQTISTAAGNLRLGGALGGTAALVKTGAQTLTLAGSNPLTNAVTVNAGTLAVASGSFAPAAPATVGNTAGSPAVLSVAAGSFNANYNGGQFTSSLLVGAVNGAAGDVKLGGGTFAVNQQFGLGAGNGGSAAFEMSGGTATLGSFLVVGFNNDNGVFNQSGGTLTIDNNLMTIAAGGSGSVSTVNLSGGTFNSLATTGYAPTIGGIFAGEDGIATLNVLGSATVNLSGWGLRIAQNSGATGTVNLLGGTIATTSVSAGGGTSQINFNGGTLKARSASTSFFTGIGSAYIYGGGANINDGGYAITVGQPLLAPSGYGVSSISLDSGGSGYIAPPVVNISGGSGAGAAASAQMNPASGTVTNIFITNPGSGYAAADVLTVAFLGGGGSGATANPPVLTINQSGGLIKSGTGTLTLTNACTFSGPTVVSAGKLALSGAGSVANSANITISNAATFDVSAANHYTLGAAQVLQGNGTVNGPFTASGTITPGAASIGTLTLNNTPVLNGITLMKINRNNGSFLNDQIKLPSATVNYGGTLTVTNLGASLQAGDTFQLFSATGYSGSFVATNLPPLNSDLGWSNSLTANGRVAVVNVVSLVPTNLAWTVSGTNLALSWPADHIGWTLQVQTNDVNTGLSNNWQDVAGSTTTNQIVVPMVPANGTVFYRIFYP
jgi:autotransporter-associated beta strand protein